MRAFRLQYNSHKIFLFPKTTRHDKLVALQKVLFNHLLHFNQRNQIANLGRSTIKKTIKLLLEVLHSFRAGKASGKKGQHVWFFRSFSGFQIKRFGVGKSFVHVLSTVCQKPRSSKICILRIPLSQKSNWRFSHVFFRSKDDSNHWNKKTNKQIVLKRCFSVAPIVIKLFEKIVSKKGASNGVWSVQEEHTSSNSHVPSRFGVKIDRNQLMISDNSAKYRKVSHRKSCRIWLAWQISDCIFPILTSSVSVTITLFDILKKKKHSPWKQGSFIDNLGFWAKNIGRHFKTAF